MMAPNHTDYNARQTPSQAAGILLLCVAALLWSLNGAIIKLLYADGTGPPGTTIAFYRSLVAGLFLLPFAFHHPSRHIAGSDRWFRFRSLRAAPGQRSLFGIQTAAVLGTVLFTVMTIGFVIANTMTTAANAIILQYTSTFWVFALSPLLLKERSASRDFWLLGVAMVGIAIIFAGNARTDLAGLVVALGAGLAYGLQTIMIRRLRSADSAAVAVLLNLGSAALLLPAVALFGQFSMSPREWLLMVTMGVVQFGIPYYLYTLGLRHVRASRATLITLLEPILVPVWTYLAVAEIPPGETLLGGVIILAALLLLILGERKGSPTPSHSTADS